MFVAYKLFNTDHVCVTSSKHETLVLKINLKLFELKYKCDVITAKTTY